MASSRSAPSLRVLVVSPVGNNEGCISTFRDNMQKLTTNQQRDAFDFILFLYKGDSLWRQQAWYHRESSRIIEKHIGPGCTSQFWARLQPSTVEKYTHIWLIDEDIHLGFFSWDIYRAFLTLLDPLVSQPAILPAAPGLRSSDLTPLNMRGGRPPPSLGCVRGGQGEQTPEEAFPLTYETDRSEVMTPILSTRIWSAVFARLQGSDTRCNWYIDSFWDLAGLAARVLCRRAGVLVVNSSPARHLDNRSHRNFDDPADADSVCLYRCPPWEPAGVKNNRRVSLTESVLVQEGMRGYCDNATQHVIGKGNWLLDDVRSLSRDLKMRRWTMQSLRSS